MTEGVPPASTTRAGDALNLGAATATSRAATKPVTTMAAASEPAGRVMVNVLVASAVGDVAGVGGREEVGKDGSNSQYGALGAWATADEGVPRAGARVGLVVHGEAVDCDVGESGGGEGGGGAGVGVWT